MFGLGAWEVVVILLLALIVLGPEKLPEVARKLAKFTGELRRVSDDVRRNFDEASRDIPAFRAPLQPPPSSLAADLDHPPTGPVKKPILAPHDVHNMPIDLDHPPTGPVPQPSIVAHDAHLPVPMDLNHPPTGPVKEPAVVAPETAAASVPKPEDDGHG